MVNTYMLNIWLLGPTAKVREELIERRSHALVINGLSYIGQAYGGYTTPTTSQVLSDVYIKLPRPCNMHRHRYKNAIIEK